MLDHSRKDGVEREYWGYISRVEEEGELLRITTPNGVVFHVPPRLTKLKPPGPGSTPWMKFFRYVQQAERNLVTHVESRAVDTVPVKLAKRAFYLIARSDSGLLAIPGGFIDEEDGARGGVDPLGPALQAAVRELYEETGAQAKEMRGLGRQVQERMTEATAGQNREHVSLTWPFVGIVSEDCVMQPGDDARQARGDPGLEPGWYALANGVPAGLHFAHHAEILERAFRTLGESNHGAGHTA
jgi:8-oxo-dGTP pyrophosphatase MutT (NUDIX family)